MDEKQKRYHKLVYQFEEFTSPKDFKILVQYFIDNKEHFRAEDRKALNKRIKDMIPIMKILYKT